jgi:hypothetical protein
MANPAREPDKNCQGVLVGIASASNPTYTEGHQVPLSTDLNGVLRVNATLEAGGDASAANQTTMIGHLAAIETAVEGTVDVNIVSGAGSGGTASTDDADFTAATTSGTPAMGVYESSPTSVTDGDMGIVGITQARRLKTSATIDAALPAGTNAIGKLAANSGVDIGDVDVTSCALPTGASTSAKQDTIIGHLDGVEGLLTTIDADTSNLSVVGGGTEAAAIRVTIANNSTGVLSVDDNGSTLSIDDGAGSITVDNGGTFAVQVSSIAAGNNNIGDVDVASLPALPAGNNNIGDVDVASIAAGTNTIGGVIPKPTTSGGLTIFRSLDLDETEEEVKATAGQLYGIWFTNQATSVRWLKLYNATAANVTVGTTTPVITIGLPGNSTDKISGALLGGDLGIAFSTAITVAATTGVADNDTGAPSANDVIVNIFYS